MIPKIGSTRKTTKENDLFYIDADHGTVMKLHGRLAVGPHKCSAHIKNIYVYMSNCTTIYLL